MPRLEKGPAFTGIQTHVIPQGTFPFGSPSALPLICASSMHSSPKHHSIDLPSMLGRSWPTRAPGTTVNILP